MNLILKLLGIDIAKIDRLNFSLESPFAFWLLGLILIAAAFYFFFRNARLKEIPVRSKQILLALQIAALILFLFIALQPNLKIEGLKDIKPVLAVLMDQSGSMGIQDPGPPDRQTARPASTLPQKRKEIANKLATEINKKLKRKYEIVTTNFGGAETAIGDAINSIEKENLAAIVILSDGNNNAGLDPLNAARNLSLKGVSVYTVGIGSPSSGSDVAIEKVIAPEVGIIGEKTKVKLELKGIINEEQKNIKLQTFETDNLILEKQIEVEYPDFQKEIDLEFSPGQRGITGYRAEIEALPGEDILENNSCIFHINNILKQKVLYLEGGPSFEYKFLSRTLKDNPAVTADVYLGKKGGKIFIDKVSNYDSIIIGNLTEGEISKLTIDAIAQAVKEKNTSLILLGGKHAFGQGGWENTSLYELLPVEIGTNTDYQTGQYNIDLTADGIYSPALQLTDNPDANLLIWQNLPPLQGINLLKAKDNALVLIEHKIGNQNHPILAVAEQDKSKVITLATDDTWRWGFLPLEVGKSAEPYLKFWENILKLAGSIENLSAMDLPQAKSSLEMQQVALNVNLLKNLAELGHGKFYPAAETSDIYQNLKAVNKQAAVKYEIEIWRKVPLFLMLMGLLGVEWFLRRKWRVEM